MRGLRTKADIYALLGISFFLLRFLHQQPIIISGSAASTSSTAVTMSLVNSLVQVTIIVFAVKRHSLFEQPLALILLAGISSVGQILMFSDGGTSATISNSLIIGSIMTSFGAAMLPLLWHEIACGSEAAGRMRYVVAVATIASATLFLVAVSFPEPISTILDSISPMASLIFLLMARKARISETGPNGEESPNANEESSSIAHELRPYAPLLATCFVCTAPQGLIRSAYFPALNANWYSLQTAIAVAILATTVVLAVLFSIESRVKFRFANLGIFQLAVVAGMVAPFFTYPQPSVTAAAIISSFLFFWVFFYSALHDACTQPYQGVIVYSLGIICSNLAGSGSALLGQYLAFVPMQITGAILVVVCLASLAFAGNFLYYDTDLDAIGTNGEDRTIAYRKAPANNDYENAVERQCSIVARDYGLSAREGEVLSLIVRGFTAKSISNELFISYNTVRTHISRIYTKIDVHNREELLQIVNGRNTDGENEEGPYIP